jgi:hypothetical protein
MRQSNGRLELLYSLLQIGLNTVPTDLRKIEHHRQFVEN